MIQHYVVHDNATCLSWHPNASYLLTSGKDRTIRIIDVLEGKPLYTLTGHDGAVSCVAFSKNGENFASGGSDMLVMVREICSLISSSSLENFANSFVKKPIGTDLLRKKLLVYTGMENQLCNTSSINISFFKQHVIRQCYKKICMNGLFIYIMYLF